MPFNAAFSLNSFTASAWVNMAAGFGAFLNGIVGTRFGGDNTFDYKVQGGNIHGDGGAGTDLMLVDTSNGDQIPTGDMTFNGEQLRVERVTGAAAEAVTVQPTATAGTGQVTITGQGNINYTGTSNIDLVNLVDVTPQSATVNDTITIANGLTATNGGTVSAAVDLAGGVWVVNGIEVSQPGMMPAVPQRVGFTRPATAGAVALTTEQLAPIVEEAIGRLSAGATAAQVAAFLVCGSRSPTWTGPAGWASTGRAW